MAKESNTKRATIKNNIISLNLVLTKLDIFAIMTSYKLTN